MKCAFLLLVATSLGCAPVDRPAVRAGTSSVSLDEVLRETAVQVAARGEDPSEISADRAYAYASQVAARMADRMVLEARAGETERRNAAARADEAMDRGVRIAGVPAASLREAVYMDGLVRALVPEGADVEAILTRWRDEAGVSIFVPYDVVATPRGPRPGAAEIAGMVLLAAVPAGASGFALRRS